MAIYDFKCGECGRIEMDVVLPMSHEKEDRPGCCGAPMGAYITVAPMTYFRDYEVNYQPVSVRGAAPITSRKQEREFMNRHGLIHASEANIKPPSVAEDQEIKREIRRSIDAITPSERVARELDIV